MEEKSDVKQSKPSRRRPRPAGAARARVAHQVCIFLRHVREGARGRKRGRGESVFRVCVCGKVLVGLYGCVGSCGVGFGFPASAERVHASHREP